MTPVTTKPRLEGGYSGFPLKPEYDPMYAPVSPRMVSEGGLLKRMNTIAPGPFDINNRRRENESRDAGLHQRQRSVKDIGMGTKMADIGGELKRPNTASGHSRGSSNNSSGGSKSVLPRLPRKNGYGGFGPPTRPTNSEDERREFLRPEDRSQTYPLPSPNSNFRRPSEPDTRMRKPTYEPMEGRQGESERQRRPSFGRDLKGPDLSRPLPPRGTSMIRPRTDARLGDAPPVPNNLNLAAEFGIGNPYHTPSTSQSSNASGYSEASKASSRSSPPKSAGSGPRRKPSDTTQLDILMSEVQASMNSLQSSNNLSESPPSMEKEQFARGMPGPRNLDPSLLSPESPMDPAIQDGRLSPLPLAPIPSRNPARSARPQAPVSPTKITASPPHVSRPTTSKGNCKGCGDPIKGKSISSADGRLTGRYHKGCFVCATCSEPFQTSTFYVINDAPYCERHYHKLNGSTCAACDKGIEGQYLESERKQKFHPVCLTCADCKRTLKNDYFEMDGRVFCERDAWRRAQKGRYLGTGGPTSRMERRTTRLMMM
jgi:hypothetical protein